MPKSSILPSEKVADARLLRGERTRVALLDAAFEEIHRHGYRAASLNDILKAAGCTKGSLYHHFPDKHALGLAAIASKIDQFMELNWLAPLARTENPVAEIKAIISRHLSGEIYEDLRLGCPVQNLSVEMSGLDEDFRLYLNGVNTTWREALASSLKRGQQNGTVRMDINPNSVAAMILATHQGTIGLMKAAQDTDIGRACSDAFFQFLNGLRPDNQQTDDDEKGQE